MRIKHTMTTVAAMLAVALSLTTQAEVIDANAHGFSIRHVAVLDAERMTTYNTAIQRVGEWWSDDHTFSGDARNLSIDDRVQGCFCERLGEESGLVHMTVTFADPGVLLRLTGGLGPLGLMGVAGNMTWEFTTSDGNTVITLNYAVGGYMDGGLDSVAAAVDGVLVEQMSRLKRFVETGSPVAMP